jgi:hypothetical protein
MSYGLHNVLMKFTPNASCDVTPIRFYSSAAFLTILQIILKRGYVVEVADEALKALENNYDAYLEFSRGNYLTSMADDKEFAPCYPCRECSGKYRVSNHYYHDTYYYPLFHTSWTNDLVKPVYGIENYLPRIIYDLLHSMLKANVPIEELPKLMAPNEEWVIRQIKGNFLTEPGLGLKMQSKVWKAPDDATNDYKCWEFGKFVEPTKLWNYEGKHTLELHLPCADTIEWYKNFMPLYTWQPFASR